MELKGWVRSSLIDYPEHIATVLFTGGCNFRCPMCHNADLVLRPAELPSLPEEAVWDFLARRQGLIDGVVISGGEPTLQADLAAFLEALRQRGLDIKLDTNGYRPAVLECLLADGLVDYVALDVKAPLERYPALSGRPDADPDRVESSIEHLRHSDVTHEFRTTVVPGMLSADDVEAIARRIAGADRYVLQQFRPVGTLDPELENVSPHPVDVLEAMAARAERWVDQVHIRRI
ncbi:MAG: anaerobic ribonucleoside-triphosphate reductase activating protein [Anaerolineae bacterium]|jgi:pyruvate formate lyase activating enzyme